MRFIDDTLGKWTRHFFFVLVRTYYAFFDNVGASGKELLQQQPGTLILATHASRHEWAADFGHPVFHRPRAPDSAL
jgi:hypothetical protein